MFAYSETANVWHAINVLSSLQKHNTPQNSNTNINILKVSDANMSLTCGVNKVIITYFFYTD